jgi:hypothetical protein
MLSVNPSPEFVARVRTQVAREPVPHPWRLSWTLGTVVAAAAVVAIAAYVGPGRERAANTARPPLAARVLPNSGTVASGSTQRTEIRALRDGASIARLEGPAAAAPTERRGNDVLLDPRESAALRALIYGVRRGEVDLSPVLRASTPSAMTLPPLTEIAIEPITIAPLVDEGERQ